MKVKSKSNSVIRDLVASLENAEVVEQAMAMDETEADTTMVNEEINELSQEMYSIENHIDEAISIVEEDSDLADYAEARSDEQVPAEEVPSLESFVLMLNNYNERSRRCYGKTESTLSLEAAEEFEKDDPEAKKSKLKGLAGAAKERAGKIIESIINAIKDMLGKLNDFRKALFDKSLKLTKQATELKNNLSDDKTEEKEVKTSRAAKILCVSGKFDIKHFSNVESNMKTVEDYVSKISSRLANAKEAPKDSAAWEAMAEFVDNKLEMTGNWKNLGDQEYLLDIMPGDVLLTRELVDVELPTGNADAFFKYSMIKNPNPTDAPESIPFLDKNKRESLVEIALELAKYVSENKSNWKDVDNALGKVKKLMEKDYKAAYEDKKEGKLEFKEAVKIIKTILSNVKSCSSDMQKYSLTQAEALLVLVREHDKVAAGGSEKKDEKEQKEAA